MANCIFFPNDPNCSDSEDEVEEQTDVLDEIIDEITEPVEGLSTEIVNWTAGTSTLSGQMTYLMVAGITAGWSAVDLFLWDLKSGYTLSDNVTYLYHYANEMYLV